MEKNKIGEMYLLTWKNEGQNADWTYGVVVKVFDGRIELLRQDGSVYFLADKKVNDDLDEVLESQPTNTTAEKLYVNGRPAISKKNLLGKYTFQPK